MLGVYTTEFVPKGTRFGPLKGQVHMKDTVPKGASRKYFWRVSTSLHHDRNHENTKSPAKATKFFKTNI